MKKAKRGKPATKYSQAVRLLDLYDRANRGEILRAADGLALSLGVDKRTLQRDLAILRNIGKLQSTEGSPQGWYLPKAERNWGMGIWNVLGISLGARAIGFMAGPLLAGQVQPLLSQLRRSLSTKEQIDLEDLEQRLHVTELGQKLYRVEPQRMRHLEAMATGLLQQRPIELTYLSPKRQMHGEGPRALSVQAICLVVHRGGVYFVVDVLAGGVDPKDNGRLLLSLDRLESVSVDVEAPRRAYPSDFRPDEYFRSAFGIWRGEEAHAVRLRVDRLYASAVRERAWHRTQKIEEQPDGSVLLTMQLGTLDEVADWVLGMGEQVFVEAPEALVELVRSRLERALGQYRRPP